MDNLQRSTQVPEVFTPPSAGRSSLWSNTRGLLHILWSSAPGLTTGGALIFLSLVFSLICLVFDHHIITGLPAWEKPTKFSLSTLIYCLSLGGTLYWIREWRRVTSVVEVLIAAALVVEIVIVDLQAARHTTSHFNLTSTLNAHLYQVMGMGIIVLWLGSLVIASAAFRQRFASPVWGWSLRLGLVLSLIGSASGAFMLLPTPQQLAQSKITGKVPYVGAHTVGAPDGGRGIPFLGWSADYGDLRIAHFIGIHGLQMIPLLAIATRRTRNQRRRLHIVLVGTLSYLTLFVLILKQALRGQSLIAPDPTAVLAFFAWAAATVSGFLATQSCRDLFHTQGFSMSADLLFRICGILAQVGWLLLIFFGRRRWASSFVCALIIPVIIALFYTYAIVAHRHELQGSFGSLDQVQLLFSHRWVVLAGWLHYLAFDLFVGAWQARDAFARKISHLYVIPCLVLTLLFGPIGLLLYLALRTITTRRQQQFVSS